MRSGVERRVWGMAALAAMLAAAPGAGPARAQCLACSAEMWCVASPSGATLCLGNGEACLMGGRCRAGGSGGYLSDYAMIQLTVLEDAPGPAGPGRARVLREAGPLAVGRAAQRLAREAAGGTAAEPGIVFSGVGSGEGATVAFRSPLGDGFTLRRDADGRGAVVTLRALHAGRPGMTLARERLDERDALAVRVTLEGRARIVIVQAPTLPRAEGEAREREARLALRGANGARPVPPFELEPVAD
jgi:hypothetical protein